MTKMTKTEKCQIVVGHDSLTQLAFVFQASEWCQVRAQLDVELVAWTQNKQMVVEKTDDLRMNNA